MHTIQVVLAGLVLLALMALVGRFGGFGFARAATWFIPVWLIGAAANMWVGVAQAGYPVSAEFPIFLLVFAVPAAIALLVRWKLG